MGNNINRQNVEDILALTPMQQGMLFHYLKHSESSEYFEQLSLRLSVLHCKSHRLCRKIDIKTIQMAWNHVALCNEMLRTVYRWDKLEAPVQAVLKSYEVPVRLYDIKDKDRKEQEKLITDIKQNDINMGIDIRKEPFRITVIELSEEESEMLVSNHHILYDGWSSGIIVKEFLEAYKAISTGKEIKKRAKPKFKDYIKWQNKQNTEAKSTYWKKYLEGYEGKSVIPGCTEIKEKKESIGAYETDLDNETRKNLAEICRREEVTEATVINTAWGILLQQYNDKEDVVFGTTVSGRHAELVGIEEAVGLYINTLPLRVRGEKEEKTGELIRRIEAETRARANDETVALTEIQAERGIGQGEKLFDTLVVIENYPIDKTLNSEDEIIRIEMSGIREVTNYDITVSVMLGKRIEIKTIFREDKYEGEGIKKLAQHFKNIIKALAEGGNKTVKEIEMLGEEEKKQILEAFNATGADYAKNKTIHQLFEEKAEKTPDNIAVVYEEQRLSYRELNEKSNQLARMLREKGVKGDSIVGIMVERSLEMLIGIIGILKAGGAYLPIDPEYPTDRISYMLNDSNAQILLTHKSWGDKLENEIEKIKLDEEVCCKGDASNLEHTATPQNLAYIIYTSGSTGKPKGVMIRHQSVVNILTALEKEYPLEKEDAYLLKTAYTFDVSVTELFGWFIGNGRLVMLPNGDEKDAKAIITAIGKNNITHVNFVPSMLNIFIDELLSNKVKELGKLRYVFAAGEALGIETVKRFEAAVEGVRLENIYGPTEITIYATSYPVENDKNHGSIPIGKPMQNVKAYILDRNNGLQPIGIAGELCIGGDGLAAGYLNKPELTAEKFMPNPFIPGEKLYRTGDLARWLPDGNIEYLGRIDEQVKIRGYRIELGEIESRLLSYEAVKAAVVAAREDENGDKYLCAYIMPERKGEMFEPDKIREHLMKVLPGYMLPAYYVELDKLPLTGSGKVDKKALPNPEGSVNTGKDYEAPRNEMEEKLASIWQEILKADKIGINDSFFELGGHSLKAISMVSKIHKDLNIEISLKDVFKSSTIKQLAKDIEGKAQSGYKRIETAAEERDEMPGYYPASSAQKRIYTLQQFDTGSTAYNLPMVLTVKEMLDKDRLEATFQTLVKRHEAFRTSFEMVYRKASGEEIIQKIHKEAEIKIEYREIKDSDRLEKRIREFVRPFDLGTAPLMRVELIKTCSGNDRQEEAEYMLLIDMHHIISDRMSIDILTREFAALYEGKTLADNKVQYRDYAAWQNKQLKSVSMKKQKEYWLERLSGELPVLNMPTDYTRPTVQTFAGEMAGRNLNSQQVEKLRERMKQSGSTLYMYMLCVFNILLAKYSGQEDIIVGSPIAGRTHGDLENIIGMFVNTLAMRNYPNGEKSFNEFLQEVKENALRAYENQDYQFEELVEQLNIKRDLSRNPLFDIMFAVQKSEEEEITVGDIKLVPKGRQSEISKFDMTLTVEEQGENLMLILSYNPMIYRKETMERLLEHFSNILADVAENPEKKLGEIQLLGEIEKKQILEVFNRTGADYQKSKTIHRLFEEKAEKTPDNIAVVYEEQRLSYRELNEKSNQLARMLRKKGVKGNSIVGIMVERSLEMLIGIIGILKAGGAYLPIDPEYPADRISYILNDSNAQILLTHKSWGEKSDSRIGKIYLDEEACFKGDASNLEHIAAPHNLAYIIYTSGSTGKPKGVMIRHQNAINILTATEKEYPLEKEDAFLLKTTCTFDVSVLELFGWFIGNGKLVILPNGDEKDAKAIIKAIINNDITHINFVPSMLNIFVEELENRKEKGLGKLKYVFAGGEVLEINSAKRFLKAVEGVRLVNLYGPTETTIYVTGYTVENESIAEGMSIPIGRPVQNVKAYILDCNNSLQPIGIAGELCIGGDGLAAGYLNKPELTAEKFVPNPFIPGEKLYKTGDLARWLPDGNIEYLGRIDEQVKIRGYRIELGEIESRLVEYEGVKAAVVAAREDENGDKYLCAYITTEGKGEILEVGRIREQLMKVLPEYMLPSYYVKLDEFPLTNSGKVNRKALPEPEFGINTGKEYEAPRNETEEKLAVIWQEILKADKIGINDNFFELGGHSLKATSMVARIYREMKAEIPLKDVFQAPTIKLLSERIDNTAKSKYEEIDVIGAGKNSNSGYYMASSAQKRIYTLQQFDKESVTYNISMAFAINGSVDKKKLENAFELLVKRHESLRTSFELMYNEAVPDEIVQHIREKAELKIKYIEAETAEEKAKQIREFIKPFDLGTVPLMRVGLIKTYPENCRQEGSEYMLLLDMHHIISDIVSIEILAKEFAALYEGKELPDIKLQYKDYAAWQNKRLKSESMKKQKEYWLEKLNGELPVLNMPTDYLRPTVQTFEGDCVRHSMGRAFAKRVSDAANRTGTTIYMYLLAVFNILLSRYSGQEDIIVGSPIAGRNQAGLENIIGMFVNTLAMRNHPHGEKSFNAFLQEVKENALRAYENQDYQFEEMVECLNIQRDLSRNPLFDIMFAVQSDEQEEIEIGGMKLIHYDIENRISKFDMTLTAVEKAEDISFSIEYNTKLLKRASIERLMRHYINILCEVLSNAEKKLNEIELIGEEEKKQILFEFNDTKANYPMDKTIHQLFEEQAEKTPHKVAVVYGDEKLTYMELNGKANRLARMLRKKGVKEDSIVGIMVERSMEMIIGIMGILKAGGAYLPIDPAYPEDRIRYMLEDSGVRILLTHKGFGDKAGCEIEKIRLDEMELYKGEAQNLGKVSDANHMAYVIYTSGTTGKPKGVMIEHGALINRINWMQKKYPINEDDVLLQKTPYTFDVSLWELFWWSISGASVCMLEQGGEKDPVSIIKAVEKNKVTTMHFVPSMLDMFLDYAGSHSVKADISSLRQVFASGEALTLQHVNRFKEILGKKQGVKLINLYGPTEATVDVSYYDCMEVEREDTIPIGKPIDNIELYVLDKSNHIQPVGVHGELCIAGAGLARGYLNKPELTAEKFVPNPYIPGEKMYRTGDLARWLPDGNIEFLGRIDHQVKIRGCRIELGEIESHLAEHEDIKEAVVKVWENENADKYLCAYITPENKGSKLPETSRMKEYLMKLLPEYMVPSYFVELDELPLTTNGKVDRKALPEPDGSINTGEEYEAPRNEIEKKLAVIWQEILKLDKIGINDSFFELGGHSLKATAMIARVYKEASVEIPLKEIFKAPTIKALGEYIRKQEASKYKEIEKAVPLSVGGEPGCYPSSSAQKRLYTLQQIETGGTGYNMPAIFEVEGQLEEESLKNTFCELIKRHESLRTSFYIAGEEIIQKIHKEVELSIEYYEAKEEEGIKEIEESFIRPFELDRAPLMRVGLITCEGQKVYRKRHILMVDLHHIISDGVSMGILMKDFGRLYSGESLPDLRLQYKDYAAWQKKRLEIDALKKQEKYWLEEYAGEIPVLNLPTDYPRPVQQSFEGAGLEVEADKELTEKLKALTKETGVTLYMLLLAGFNILLSKYSGQEDIVVGSPIAGRTQTGLEGIIGMFVNTLAIRNYPEARKTFREFLQEVKAKCLKAYENQEYQFEELVDKVNVIRDLSRNPIFDVMLTLQNMEIEEAGLKGLIIRPYEMENRVSKFDITVSAQEQGEILRFEITYCTKLFKKAAIERMSMHYLNILERVTEQPDSSLEEIGLIGEEEKKQLLEDFNDTNGEYQREKTIQELFEEKARKMPEAIAVEYEEKVLTYSKLNEKANRLAGVLAEKGVRPDSIVGIMVERSPEMIIGIIGILKAGGAYLPIDPGYPNDRINYMLEDSGAQLLLAHTKWTGKLKPGIEKINLDNEELYEGDADNPKHTAESCNLAYVIYTSGSTGKPKGVMVEHKSVINILTAMEKEYPLEAEDAYLLKTAYTFDVSVTELFGWFIGNGRLVILPQGEEKDAKAIAEIIVRKHITHVNFVPSMLNIFIDEALKTGIKKLGKLKYLLAAGEALGIETVKRFEAAVEGVRLENIYGPTEITIYATSYKTEGKNTYRSVPIGRPMQNVKAYIIGKNNYLQPIGVPGELCIAGCGLARGYINNAVLTGEKFVVNPFIPGEKMYRTGDLARWLPDGNIEFLGRIDHQVKIRGYRIEPGEIENQLMKHGYVKEAAVIAKEDSSGKYLCAYIAVEQELVLAGLREHLAKELPDYMIPSYFIQLKQMPLNRNGKIDRKGLPEPDGSINTGVLYEAPRNELEEKLVSIWQEVLKVERVGINDSFFELGGHSLKATAMIASVHKKINVEVPLKQIFKAPTIKALGEYIRKQEASIYQEIERAVSLSAGEESGYYPASSAQKRLYTLQQMEIDSTSYNMPAVFELEGQLSRERLLKAFKSLIERHESLRTSFEVLREEVRQKVHREVTFEIEYKKVRLCGGTESTANLDDTEKEIKEFIRPFDLSKAPLLRAGLIELDNYKGLRPAKYILMYDMHHIISDGVSMRILLSEFMKLYEGKELPEPRIQYKDYVVWQDMIKNTEGMKKQEKYWLKQFIEVPSTGGIPVLNLPTDYPRPLMQSFEGDTISFEIDKALTERLRGLAKEESATLYMVLLAAYNVLLSKYTGQEDIIIGSPTAGRCHADFSNIIGMFVNTLPMRNFPQGRKTFREFLKEVKETVLGAYENQDYQFEELVYKLNIPRNLKRNPLFDVMFTLQNTELGEATEAGIKITPLNAENRTSRVDMALIAAEGKEEICMSIEYCTKLFKKETMRMIADHYTDILELVSNSAEIEINKIALNYHITEPETIKSDEVDFDF